MFIEAAKPAAIGAGMKMVLDIAGGEVRPRAGRNSKLVSMRPEDRARLARQVKKLLAAPAPQIQEVTRA